MSQLVNEQTALNAAFDSSGRRPSIWSPHFAGSQMGSWRRIRDVCALYVVDVTGQNVGTPYQFDIVLM